MNKKLLVLVIVVSAALFAAGGIFAKAVPDMIKLEDPTAVAGNADNPESQAFADSWQVQDIAVSGKKREVCSF